MTKGPGDEVEPAHTVGKFSFVPEIIQHVEYPTPMAREMKIVEKDTTHLRKQLKGAGSHNRKQTSYLYDLCCCPHVAIVFRSDFGGWGESTRKILLTNSRVHLQNNTYILKKVVEVCCDMDYQKY